MTSVRRLVLLRRILLCVAVGVPAFFFFDYRSRTIDLRSLRDHGRLTDGEVTGVSQAASKTFVRYAYTVDGRRYESDADGDHASSALPTLVVTYLPEDPVKNWVGPPLTDDVIREETAASRTAVPITMGVLRLAFLANEFQLRRQRRLPAGAPFPRFGATEPRRTSVRWSRSPSSSA